VTALCVVALLIYSVFLSGLTAALMTGPVGRAFAVGLFALSYVFFATATWSLTTSLIQNLVWRHTALGPHTFLARWKPIVW
jgi:hypothetical protein